MVPDCKHLARVAAAMGLAAAAAGAHGAETDWMDVEGRIQYGYYTEDPRSLRAVMELLAPAAARDATQSYYAGLANYRLSQLAVAKDRSRARQTAQACVSSLDTALRAREDFAEALALQSACLELLASLDPWRTPFAAARSGTQIEKARHLAPGNPRVLLLDAIEEYERPKGSTAGKERALSQLKQAAVAFEAERKDTEHVPGWGAAEAYLYLARSYLDRGATLEARDALERALLIAPEFAEARRLMARIVSG